MNTNQEKFVDLIKNHQFNYHKKLENVIKLNVVVQVSRQMLLEFAEIYQLVNPQYNVKMLNIGCGSCVLSFLKDVADVYFNLLNTIEAPIEVEEVDTLSEDLERMTNEDVVIKEEAPVIPKKKGRPFSKNLPK